MRSAGGRLAAALALDDAIAWLDHQTPADAVLLDLATDHGDPLDRLLDTLETHARAGRYAVVVTMPKALVDIVAARLAHPAITLLVEPEPAEVVAALAQALVLDRSDPLPHNPAQEQRHSGGAPSGDHAPDADLSAAQFRTALRGRRLRNEFFEAWLFADPAWDMLLDLAASRLEGRRVSVSSLCIAAAVPATTALGWIKVLTEKGLFVRVDDPADRRRVFIELSETAWENVRAYVHAARSKNIAGL